MDASQLLAYLHAINVGEMDGIRAKLQEARQACRQLGQEPVLLKSFGGGDTNHFNNRDLTSIVFGLGMEGIHSPDEYILLERLEKSAALLQQIVWSI